MKYVVNLKGKNYEVEVNESEAVLTSVYDAVPVAAPVAAAPAAEEAAPAPKAAAVSAEGTKILSPMPGAVLKVNVSQGQAVKKGDVLMILEAMKMENDISAPCDGVVKQIVAGKGTTVNTDEVLMVI